MSNFTDIKGGEKSTTYNVLGTVTQATSNGVTTTVTTDTEYRVPVEITTGSFTSTAVYGTDFLGLTEQEGPNGDTMSVSYNGMARPTSTTSPLGATTTYTYNDTANPPTFKTTTNNKWVQNTVDGLGRTIKSEAGYSTTTVSVSEVEYDSCGCSPTGKVKKTSLPFAPGGTKIWTTYTYDGIGRTLSKLTDGTETDTSVSYVYEGNTVKVTDAAGKWKKYTTDVLGRLIQVNEPNPAGGSDYVTTYTYNYWGQLTGVSMPRPTGTQTRSWTYNGSLQLTSTTNPENGTVSYTYNSDRTLATKTDAKSQITQYSYDSYKRVAQVRRGTSGSSHVWNTLTASAYSPFSNGTFKLYLGSTLLKQGNFSGQTYTYFYEGDMDFSQDDLRVELSNGQYMVANALVLNGTYYSPPGGCGYDCTYATVAGYSPSNVFGTRCGREDYFYDANPFNSTYSTKVLGRLAAVRYWGGPCGTSDELTFVEMYGYNAPGATTKKRLRILKGTYTRDLDSTLTFNNEGQMLTMAYPNSGPTITNEYNSMGRLQKLKEGSTYLINDATYNAAGQLTFLDGVNGAPDETRAYNSIGQMTQLTIGSGLDMEYGFPATGNNGKLDYEKDLITGEKVTYTYDALNRLASATSDVNPGWGQSFAYDGFGNNTTQTVTKGTAPSLSVTYSASTNRRTTDCADANGNIGSVANSCSEGYTFDVLNRITAVGSSAYSYSPNNQRVWRNTSATGAEITYYGATGQKLRTFSLSSTLTVTTTGTFYYFGGKLIKNAGGFVSPDRLGSHGKFFPYGNERPSATSNDKEKFATYHRDADTGLDYANNRYHQPGHGRFLTPDPAQSGWNWYAYAGGDPVNRVDPSGLEDCAADFCITHSEGSGAGDEGMLYQGYDNEWLRSIFNLGYAGDIPLSFFIDDCTFGSYCLNQPEPASYWQGDFEVSVTASSGPVTIDHFNVPESVNDDVWRSVLKTDCQDLFGGDPQELINSSSVYLTSGMGGVTARDIQILDDIYIRNFEYTVAGASPRPALDVILNGTFFPGVSSAVAAGLDGGSLNFVDLLNLDYGSSGYTFDATSAFTMALLHEYRHLAGGTHQGTYTTSQYNMDIIESCMK